MPIAGPDKRSSTADPKKPTPPTEEDAEESKDAGADPKKRTWQ
jgi:hypothetical protein